MSSLTVFIKWPKLLVAMATTVLLQRWHLGPVCTTATCVQWSTVSILPPPPSWSTGPSLQLLQTGSAFSWIMGILVSPKTKVFAGPRPTALHPTRPCHQALPPSLAIRPFNQALQPGRVECRLAMCCTQQSGPLNQGTSKVPWLNYTEHVASLWTKHRELSSVKYWVFLFSITVWNTGVCFLCEWLLVIHPKALKVTILQHTRQDYVISYNSDTQYRDNSDNSDTQHRDNSDNSNTQHRNNSDNNNTQHMDNSDKWYSIQGQQW